MLIMKAALKQSSRLCCDTNYDRNINRVCLMCSGQIICKPNTFQVIVIITSFQHIIA